MKNILKCTMVVFASLFIGCEDEDGFTPTQIDTSSPQLSELDVYIRNTFVDPYNIEMQYEWDINEVDLNRFLYPPKTESVRPMLDLLNDAWIKPYSEVGGADFIKDIAPRQFTFVGSINYNISATITLGLAEAGTKITLFNIDFIDYSSIASIKRPLQTIQHEYGHILNQNKPFTTAYENITPGTYSSQWTERNDQEALDLGYITPYASSKDTEDFVEMISEMLTNTPEEFEARINLANNEEAKSALRQKRDLIKEYYLKEYRIDFDELQKTAYQAMLDVVK